MKCEFCQEGKWIGTKKRFRKSAYYEINSDRKIVFAGYYNVCDFCFLELEFGLMYNKKKKYFKTDTQLFKEQKKNKSQ